MSAPFGDDIWQCRGCGKTFTAEEWTHLVPKWIRMPRDGTKKDPSHLLLHPDCVKPYQVAQRLTK